MIKTSLRTALALSLAVLPATALHAQDADQESQDEEQVIRGEATEYIFVEGSLPLVPSNNTIASKLPLSLFLTPNNVGMVTSELMQEQNARVMGDALGNVSGINVQPGFGVTDYFVVRGFDSLSSGLILTDGAPEPEATFWQMYNVELVEVLKGPGGFLYGSNPLAGTVNLVRKQPFAAQRIAAGASYGSYNDFEGLFDYNVGHPDSDIAFRLNGLYRRSDGYRDNKESRVAAINPSFTWQIEDNHSLNANFEYVDASYSPDAGVPLIITGFDGTGSPVYEVAPVTPHQRLQLAVRPAPSRTSTASRWTTRVEISDSVTLRNKFYYRGLDWLSDGTLINGAAPRFGITTGAITGYDVFRTFIALDDKQDFLGNQAEAIFTFNTGSVSHNLLTGIEFGRYADEFTLDVGPPRADRSERPGEPAHRSAADPGPVECRRRAQRGLRALRHRPDQLLRPLPGTGRCALRLDRLQGRPDQPRAQRQRDLSDVRCRVAADLRTSRSTAPSRVRSRRPHLGRSVI